MTCRIRQGNNHGLGSVFIWETHRGPTAAGAPYPDQSLILFPDEGGKNAVGTALLYIQNVSGASDQFEHFVPEKT